MVTKQQFFRDHSQDIERLARKFSGYITEINEAKIESFLSQFKTKDLSLGLKLIRSVDYYSLARMTNLTRELGNAIFSINSSFENVLFCPMSTSSGNSADAIKRLLRITMTGINSPSLSDDNFLDNALCLSEDQFVNDNNTKTIVLVDHFLGSGESIIRTWGAIQQFENPNYNYLVGVLVGYEDAIRNVEEETAGHLNVVTVTGLPERFRAFNDSNRVFTKTEKEILKKYCQNMGLLESDQYGYQNGQSLVIFASRSPDNVLPILHHTTENWNPLFPRNL